MLKVIPVLPVLLLAAACTDPFVVIPGGKLQGEITAIPEDWGVVPEVIQLEVRPDNPYSVNIWGLADNGNLYVATQDAKWAPMITADERVRVRIEDSLYELKATRVQDEREIANVVESYARKYNMDPNDGSWAETGQVFRLTARNP